MGKLIQQIKVCKTEKMFEDPLSLPPTHSTLIAARCSGVSPLWFLFITAGLPVLGRPCGERRVLSTEGLCPGSSLTVASLLPKFPGLARTRGDIWCNDFLLRPDETLGRFGVVSRFPEQSTGELISDELFEGDAPRCLSGPVFGCRSSTECVFCWRTLANMAGGW